MEGLYVVVLGYHIDSMIKVKTVQQWDGLVCFLKEDKKAKASISLVDGRDFIIET